MAPPVTSPRERIFANYVEADGCWLWVGPCNKDGYPVFTIRRKQYRVHRISFEVFHGVQADGLLVCHRCDNPKCVNPDHLFLGSAKDNTADMIGKGRKNSPSDLRHKLTKIPHSERPKIVARRKAGETLLNIASTYGVTFQTISAICRGQRNYAATNS